MSEQMIAALLVEREGYVRFGKKDRVAAVDEELAKLGYETAKAEPVTETAIVKKPGRPRKK